MLVNKDTFGPIMVIGIMIFTFVYLIYDGNKNHNQRMKKIISSKVHGVILYTEDKSRGNYLLKIHDKRLKDTVIFYLPGSYDFIEKNIMKNDSVSKDKNSYTINFYKLISKKYNLVLRYEIDLR